MGNRDRRPATLLCLIAAALLAAGCATTKGGDAARETEDPLKYTKKLVAEGHATLYNNGAFAVPYTDIKLIPPGPDTMTFVQELAGFRARQSFEESIRKAADSVTIVADGTKRTYEFSKDIGAVGREAARAIDGAVTENGKVIVYRSTELGRSIIGRAWDTSAGLMRENVGVSIIKGTRTAGGQIIESGVSTGDRIVEGSAATGDRLMEGGVAVGKGIIESGKASGDRIIEGSAAAGDRLMEGSAGKQMKESGKAAGDRLIESDAGKRIVTGGIAAGGQLMEGAAGRQIREDGVAAGDQIIKGSREVTRRIVAGSAEAGDKISSEGAALGDRMVGVSLDAAKELSGSSIDRSGRAFRYAGTRFVKGYAAVPSNVKERISATGTNLRALNIIEVARGENEWRAEWSQKTVNLLGGTLGDYGTTAARSFRKVGEELGENYKTQGVPLSVLKSLGWVLQGLLWDATVEPIAKTTGAALGYLSVNMIAFPTVVLVKEGIATTQLAVQVTVDTAKTGYDIVAPTAIAAVAGVYGAADLLVVQPTAGALAVAGPAAGYTEKGLSAAAGKAVEGGGYVAGKTVQGGGFAAGEAVKGGSVVVGETVKAGSVVAGGAVMGGSVVAGGVVGGGSVVAGEAIKGGSIVAGEVVRGGSMVAGGLVKGGGFAAGEAVKGGGYVAGVTVMGGGYAAGGVAKAGGFVAGEGVKGGGYVAGGTVTGGGYAAGKAVQYIAIPLASAGITVGGGAIGTAVGVTGAVAGGTVVVTGEAASATSKAFGNVIAGTTLAAGTAASTAGGGAYGVYQLSKAVVVPVGYELGSGLVLSYETLSQIGAHAILAVSDCAYMVLSLEGPRWVLYAVRGKLGTGDDLPTGAVLDLKQMQEQGEEFVNLPLSDEEMRRVVESVYGSLPVTQAASDGKK